LWGLWCRSVFSYSAVDETPTPREVVSINAPMYSAAARSASLTRCIWPLVTKAAVGQPAGSALDSVPDRQQGQARQERALALPLPPRIVIKGVKNAGVDRMKSFAA
jgi:hypothetical protein